MYRKQVRRRRAVLLLLVVLSLVLISAQVTEGSGGPLNSLQRGVAAVLAPLEEGAQRALKPAGDLVDWVDETFEARGENERLETEVADLRERVVAAEAAVGENKELRKLLDLGSGGGVAGYEAVTARVIGKSPTVWYSTVTVDRGSSTGIARNDPVITGDGLAGRVTDVTRGTAQVTLITDHESAVSARVLPDGPLGVVKPEVGDPDDLILDFIENDRKVKKGAALVTAGSVATSLRSYYPPTIPIGEVTKAEPSEDETFQEVEVRPFADLRDLQFVEVLTGGPDSRAEL